MFIYETRTIYDEGNVGPLQGIVVKKADDATEWLPAEKDDVVVFLEECVEVDKSGTFYSVSYAPEFTVGEEPVPYINVQYQELDGGSLIVVDIHNGDVFGNFDHSDYEFVVNTNIDDLNISIDNENISYEFFKDGYLNVWTDVGNTDISGLVTISGEGTSISFTVNLYNQKEVEE